MEFRCNAAPKAVPCVHIAFTDDQGVKLEKPKKTYKPVRNGESINSWIDRCSRKHFTAMDAEAKKLNETDYKEMLAECKKLGIKVPNGTPFSVLADSLAKIEYDRGQAKKAEKPTLLTLPKTAPTAQEPPPAPIAPNVDSDKIAEADRKKALRKAIKAKGGKCTNFDSLEKLEKINAKLEGRTS